MNALRPLVSVLPFLLASLGARPPSSAADEPPTPAELAAKVDAKRLEADVRRLAAFGTRHTASSGEGPERGIGAAGSWVHKQLLARTGLPAEFTTFTTPASPRLKGPTPVSCYSVTIPGRDPAAQARLVVVSAHLDSRASDVRDAASDAPGANDDASGCAVVLELVRILSDVPSPCRASVMLLLVGGEEQGLLGSRHVAQRLKELSMNVEAMITLDIVGNSKGPDGSRVRDRMRVFSEGLPRGEPEATRDVRITLGGENDGPSRQLARFVREAQARTMPDFRAVLVHRPDRFLRGGDHLPFNEAGFAAVRFTEAVEDWDRQHQDVRKDGDHEYGDVADAVDYEYLARMARLVTTVVADLANAPASPLEVRIKAAVLEHVTTLRWKAPEDPAITGYEVVWRATDAPDWQESKDVGAVTEATLPVEKDDVHFGVRSYDAAGRKSLVVWPFPTR